jgi:transcriptional regulator with XRE-family HTH domain
MVRTGDTVAVQSPILSPSERGPLGQYLWTLRKAVNMSLREVEDASEKKVSNAYLSQLETGRITNPSPAILHEIAAVYVARLPKNASVSCSYERMMELAGHIRPSSPGPTKKTSRLPTFAGEQLTPEEEDDLLKYLAFIRMRKGKK